MVYTRDRDFYTVMEAARSLGISPSTVWRWIQSEQLKAYRIGPKSIRIRKEDLEALVQPVKAEPLVVDEHAPPQPPSPPTSDELARRRALFARILERRKDRVIAPLTTADLVHLARAERDTNATGG